MTVLVLFRHAKAVKHDPGGDHARPLAEAGRDAAATAGARLRSVLPRDVLVIASDARRTRETAELAFPPDSDAQQRLEPALYDASAEAILTLVRAIPVASPTVVLVGHNPGLSEIAASLAGEGSAEDLTRVAEGLATSDAVILEFAGGWKTVGPKRGRLVGMLARKDAEG